MKKKNTMKVKPLRTYKKPKYPVKGFNDSSFYYLKPSSSDRSIKKPIAAGAIFLIALHGCSNTLLSVKDHPKRANSLDNFYAKHEVEEQNGVEIKQSKSNQQENISIAPIFLHGDGMGAIGCVVVSPPVFLTEEEAFEIIIAELEKAGLKFDSKNHLLPGVFTQERMFTFNKGYKRQIRDMNENHPFYFDFYNSEYNLGIKYISRNNYFKLGGPTSTGSVLNFNLIDVAQGIREKLKNIDKVNAVIFFDPLTKREGFFNYDVKKKSYKELKKQIKDFILWMKQKILRQKR